MVGFVKANGAAQYDESVIDKIEQAVAEKEKGGKGAPSGASDDSTTTATSCSPPPSRWGRRRSPRRSRTALAAFRTCSRATTHSNKITAKGQSSFAVKFFAALSASPRRLRRAKRGWQKKDRKTGGNR